MTHSDQHGGRGVLQRVREHLPGGLPPEGEHRPVQQSLTLQVPAAEVLRSLGDPAVLSRLLGELGEVSEAPSAIDGGYRWTLLGGEGHDGLVWDAELTRREGGLRFEGPVDGQGTPGSVDAATSPAPRDLGTEVRLRVDLPLPSLAAGAAAFTLLYRLRALLQTGEVPTLRPQPAARDERG